MFECLKKCFAKKEEKVENVEFDIPPYLDKKMMDHSGFDYYFWGKSKRDEFIYLFKYLSEEKIFNTNQAGYQKEDIEYIASHAQDLIKRIIEELEKSYDDRPGDIRVENLYDLIQIILEIRRYQSIIYHSKN